MVFFFLKHSISITMSYMGLIDFRFLFFIRIWMKITKHHAAGFISVNQWGRCNKIQLSCILHFYLAVLVF